MARKAIFEVFPAESILGSSGYLRDSPNFVGFPVLGKKAILVVQGGGWRISEQQSTAGWPSEMHKGVFLTTVAWLIQSFLIWRLSFKLRSYKAKDLPPCEATFDSLTQVSLKGASK